MVREQLVVVRLCVRLGRNVEELPAFLPMLLAADHMLKLRAMASNPARGVIDEQHLVLREAGRRSWRDKLLPSETALGLQTTRLRRSPAALLVGVIQVRGERALLAVLLLPQPLQVFQPLLPPKQIVVHAEHEVIHFHRCCRLSTLLRLD